MEILAILSVHVDRDGRKMERGGRVSSSPPSPVGHTITKGLPLSAGLTVLETHHPDRPQILLDLVSAVSCSDALEAFPSSDELVAEVAGRVAIRGESPYDGRVVKGGAEDGCIQMRKRVPREDVGEVFGCEHCQGTRGVEGRVS